MLAYLTYLVSNTPPMVYLSIALVVIWCYLHHTKSGVCDNLPPFPARPYPVLGHLTMMTSDPVKTLRKWRKLKGDIFSFYSGQQLVVVINTFEVLKEVFVKNAESVSHRPPSIYSDEHGQANGILFDSGPSWKEQRSVSMAILRTFGMGKKILAESINEEVGFYLDAVSEQAGKPNMKNLRELTNASTSNVICTLLIGKRFHFDHIYFAGLLRLINMQVSLVGITNVVHVFPWLKYLPCDIFKAKKLVKANHDISKYFSQKYIREFKEKLADDEDVDNFIACYLKDMNEKERVGKPSFSSEKNLEQVVAQLFIAGTETTSTTILWALLFATHYPQEQEKVHQEIVSVIGTQRRPCIQDRPNLPYTNAFIMETQRRGSILPLGLGHLCTKDVRVAGYTIPAGAKVIANLDQILKDTHTWGDPLTFRPGRFLDGEDTLVVPEQFIPFSIGRRYCMGESLARMELFLYIAGIFQRFNIAPDDPARLPSLDPVPGITAAPKPFTVRFQHRV